MCKTVYLVDPDREERRWVESVLAPYVESVRSFDDAASLLALLSRQDGACLIVAVEPDESTAVALVRELRDGGSELPVIALGPGTALRAAVAMVRLGHADFLDRPLSAQRLRAAVARACGESGDSIRGRHNDP